MLNLFISYLDKHTVSFIGFMDEDTAFHPPKEISLYYPGIGITDIEILGKKKLKELVRDGWYHDKPDQFCMDFGLKDKINPPLF